MKILLAGFNTRAFAESAVRAGFDLESVDCFGDLDHQGLCPTHPVPRNVAGTSNMRTVMDQVNKLLDRGGYDCFCYSSGFENHPDYLAEIQGKGVRLLGNPFETVARVRDLLKVSRMLRENGFLAPEALSGQAACSGNQRKRWLKKPLGGGGGRGIEFIPHPGELPKGLFAQEYVSGINCSFSFVAAGGSCRLLGVTEQLTGTDSFNGREFGYAGNILPMALPVDSPAEDRDKMLADLESMAGWLTENFQLVGLNGVDFIYDRGRCWFIEINPRYTASMELIEMAGGLSMAGLHFDACRGVMPSVETVVWPDVFYGKQIVYTDKDVQVVYPEPADPDWVEKLRELGIRDMPHDKEIIRKGGPLATVLARGQNRGKCRQKLGELSALVRSYTKTLCV